LAPGYPQGIIGLPDQEIELCDEREKGFHVRDKNCAYHPSMAVPLDAAFCLPLLFSKLLYDPSNAGT
jgi:hypothetical protein|tara:strand:+ start:5833 stop:6033 length:201 start_codon:yes stop_codon:yes gene_type:complete